jgi:hypothetical protein
MSALQLMAKQPAPEMTAEGLSVPERIMLFCVASDTDWQRAGVKTTVPQHLIIRRLIKRDGAANRLILTDDGRAVLEALMMRAATRG